VGCWSDGSVDANGVGGTVGLLEGQAVARPISASHQVGTGDLAPNETLYVRNLNEKVNKRVLKQQLYAAFIPFGRILDIVALRTTSLRGQGLHCLRKPRVCHFGNAENARVRLSG